MSNALSILGNGYTIAISPDAEESKRLIIAASRAIVAVTDSPSCDDAQARIRELAAARIAVEKSREIVKRPVIDLGKKIDGIAKDFSADIHAEESRLTAMVNAYAAEQQRIAREAAAAAQRERQRIEREEHEARMAALRAEQEAERQRMEAERQKHEAEMAKLRAERQQDEAAQADAAAAERAAAEAQRIATEQANAARLAAEQAAADARVAAAAVVVAAPVMPQGMKEEIDFEVVDIAQFAAKFPQFVTITPKRADILAALKKSFAAKGKLPEVAGLRVFQNLKVKTR